ncbi:hypothetical protein GVX82_02235 [Patescibacteria group bacterium]|jgi:hypothetical protein|nr:hypothetical protein [Patescibacteria group bacterium]
MSSYSIGIVIEVVPNKGQAKYAAKISTFRVPTDSSIEPALFLPLLMQRALHDARRIANGHKQANHTLGKALDELDRLVTTTQTPFDDLTIISVDYLSNECTIRLPDGTLVHKFRGAQDHQPNLRAVSDP